MSAPSWILYDDTSGAVLAASVPDQQRAVASITKVMTGLLVVELADPSDVVAVSERAANTGEKSIGLQAGEQLTVDALFKALIIHSANDAATALAEHIGGSVEGFVGLMNQRAAELGLTSTSFANPHGLDAEGHFSSARDVLTLARLAMTYPQFRDAARARVLVFPDAPDGTVRRGFTTNLLLQSYEGMLGVKTGFTNHALLTIVGSAERESRNLYVVVLGSEGQRGHFADAEALLDHGFQQLAIFGTITTGARYTAMKPRTDVGPLSAAAVESLFHLAGQGLVGDPPLPAEEEPLPVPVVAHRRAEHPSPALVDTLLFWWRQLASSAP